MLPMNRSHDRDLIQESGQPSTTVLQVILPRTVLVPSTMEGEDWNRRKTRRRKRRGEGGRGGG